MKVREQAGASIPLWPAPIPAAYDSRSRGPGMHQIPPCSPFLLFNNAVATATAFFTGATEGAENGIGWSSFVRTDVASGSPLLTPPFSPLLSLESPRMQTH